MITLPIIGPPAADSSRARISPQPADAGGTPWVCCQLGAREHYAVPRSLHHLGLLAELVTDLWVPPEQRLRRVLPSKLAERSHPDLARTKVRSANLSAILFESWHAFNRRNGWELVLRRNDWFQQHALRTLSSLVRQDPNRRFCLFSFSYTARRLFEFAKARGWDTVLGQINPGPHEERIVDSLNQQYCLRDESWAPAPSVYWEHWREECQLADKIIVNSAWSYKALVQEGVPARKIRAVPLAYDPPVQAMEFRRTYPTVFTRRRPLRVLFLGQVNLRKGTTVVLEAMRLLREESVEFWFIGPRLMHLPHDALKCTNARWFGSVPRGETATFYRAADLFVFPTFSDGFGLTQLEAQAWKLPIVASRFCGSVVRDGVNGIVLSELTGRSLADVIRALLADPARLNSMSRESVGPTAFCTEKLGSNLIRALAHVNQDASLH